MAMSTDRLALARDLRHQNNAGMTYQEWVDKYNTTHGTNHTKGFACALARDLREHDAPPVSEYEKIVPLEAWRGVEVTPDPTAWDDVQAQIEHDNRYVIVEHDNDNHFPYHDPNAQRLRSEIRRRVNPHIIVVGSDAIDAPSLSRYEPDSRIPTGNTLPRFRRCWTPHVDRLSYDAPRAEMVWVNGNHDERVYEYFQRSEDYAVLLDWFVDTITADNRVHWRGTTIQQQEITIADTLTVTHGWKANKYTAAAMLREYGNQRSVMAGHSHRPDVWRVNYVKQVTAMIGGCGCLLHPAYEKRKTITNWSHGYSYGVVDTETQTCVLKHVDFVDNGDTLWAWHEGEVIRIDKHAIEYYETAPARAA